MPVGKGGKNTACRKSSPLRAHSRLSLRVRAFSLRVDCSAPQITKPAHGHYAGEQTISASGDLQHGRRSLGWRQRRLGTSGHRSNDNPETPTLCSRVTRPVKDDWRQHRRSTARLTPHCRQASGCDRLRHRPQAVTATFQTFPANFALPVQVQA